jgi:hypothetical protein
MYVSEAPSVLFGGKCCVLRYQCFIGLLLAFLEVVLFGVGGFLGVWRLGESAIKALKVIPHQIFLSNF